MWSARPPELDISIAQCRVNSSVQSDYSFGFNSIQFECTNQLTALSQYFPPLSAFPNGLPRIQAALKGIPIAYRGSGSRRSAVQAAALFPTHRGRHAAPARPRPRPATRARQHSDRIAAMVARHGVFFRRSGSISRSSSLGSPIDGIADWR